MSFKVKLFSLIIVGLLALPVIVSPQRNGEVLGARESQSGTVSAATDATPRQSAQLGEIASGIRDVRSSDTTRDADPSILTGKIVLDPNAISRVATDKFALGTGVTVTIGSESDQFVVTSSRVLTPETILVVNADVFRELGGDPENQTEIDAQVIQDSE